MTATSPQATTAAPRAEEAPTTPVARRLAAIRTIDDPQVARDLTWAWFAELGREAGLDRAGAAARLDELFRFGAPPADIDGSTEGMLVAPLIATPVDLVLRALTGAWMPWLGKRFDRAAARGDNLLRPSAQWPSRLLWPRYATWPAGDVRGAFEFETRVESGKVDPDRQTLAIDYSVVDSNPNLIIRQIRDELVEIVPGAHLGKILWRGGDGGHSLIGYFALRTPVA
jgi:hypothetical protein